MLDPDHKERMEAEHRRRVDLSKPARPAASLTATVTLTRDEIVGLIVAELTRRGVIASAESVTFTVRALGVDQRGNPLGNDLAEARVEVKL